MTTRPVKWRGERSFLAIKDGQHAFPFQRSAGGINSVVWDAQFKRFSKIKFLIAILKSEIYVLLITNFRGHLKGMSFDKASIIFPLRVLLFSFGFLFFRSNNYIHLRKKS